MTSYQTTELSVAVERAFYSTVSQGGDARGDKDGRVGVGEREAGSAGEGERLGDTDESVPESENADSKIRGSEGGGDDSGV